MFKANESRFDASINRWVFPDGKTLPVVAGGDGPASAVVQEPVIVIPAEQPAPSAPEAQEPLVPAALPNTGDEVFTRDQVAAAIEKAREQEKSKLYPRLDGLKEQLDLIQAEKDAQAEAARQAAEAAAEERRRQEEAELSAKELLTRREDEWQKQLNQVQTEWETKTSALAEELAAHKAALAKEQEYQQLMSYRSRRLAEESENIMPELAEDVSGNTPEEIDASIAHYVAKTAAILGNIQQVRTEGFGSRPKGIPTTGGGPSGPLENATENQALSLREIDAMSMQEYAKVRDRLLASVSQRR